MLTQIAALKFDLGSKYDHIVIRDVQFWQETVAEEGQQVQQLTGDFLQYVDVNKLPVWVLGNGDSITCFTTSSTTVAYFTSKLRHSRRGIVVRTTGGFVVLYRDEDRVCCLRIDPALKSAIDLQIEALEADAAAVPSTKDGTIDVILKQSQERKSVSNKKVLKNLQVSEKRLQFNETLSRLILGGLRLRGIPNSQFGFQKLYKMTFNAAEFSHRKQLQALTASEGAEITFEELQTTVETLLELFTRS